MKLKTHYLFSAGLLTLFDVFILHNFYSSLYISSAISVLGNTIIDGLGHEIKGGFIRRTPRTHTVPRSVLWGLISALPILALIFYIEHSLDIVSTKYYVATLIDGVLVGPSHMLLDVFTEKGIYVKKNGTWKRFALAHYRFDDPKINALASIFGVIMLYGAMQIETHVFDYFYHLFF